MVIKAYVILGSERYIYVSILMKSFSNSLAGKDAYRFFDIENEGIASKILVQLEDISREQEFRIDFTKL